MTTLNCYADPGEKTPEFVFLTGFESTHIVGSGKDVLDLSGHTDRYRADLESVAAAGIKTLRYSIPWHKIERIHGEYDWSWMDLVMREMRALDLEIIADPLHHTSFPGWLTLGFADPRFVSTYVLFVLRFAERYPWVSKFTYVNEPSVTSWFCGHEAVWHPRLRGDAAFVCMVLNCAEVICRLDRVLRADWAIEYVHVESCERHTAADPEAQREVNWNNQRRFLVHDLVVGNVSRAHPLYGWLRANGLTEHRAWWFQASAARIDVLGLNYYQHSEIWWGRSGRIHPPSRQGFARVARDYALRYQAADVMLSETNIRGTPAERTVHFDEMRQECVQLQTWLHARGRRFMGFCWYPWIDSTDWCSLVTKAEGRVDPQGVYSLETNRQRTETVFTRAFIQAVGPSVSAVST